MAAPARQSRPPKPERPKRPRPVYRFVVSSPDKPSEEAAAAVRAWLAAKVR